MRLGHDHDATAQVAFQISKLMDLFSPRVTAAMAADAMLKCCDDADAAAAMLLSIEDAPLPPPSAASAAAAPPPPVHEKPVCVMCMSEPPSHAFIPCGHKQLCRVCAEDDSIVAALGQKCPVCRRDFQCIVQIFDG